MCLPCLRRRAVLTCQRVAASAGPLSLPALCQGRMDLVNIALGELGLPAVATKSDVAKMPAADVEGWAPSLPDRLDQVCLLNTCAPMVVCVTFKTC